MNPEQLTALEPEKTVDARGTACPGPLLEAKRALTQVSRGGIMEVLSSDASTNKDIPLWAGKVGHEYLGTVEEAGYWRLYVRRGK
jgi:tRNA 2-thiouridine synthesizing protein A